MAFKHLNPTCGTHCISNGYNMRYKSSHFKIVNYRRVPFSESQQSGSWCGAYRKCYGERARAPSKHTHTHRPSYNMECQMRYARTETVLLLCIAFIWAFFFFLFLLSSLLLMHRENGLIYSLGWCVIIIIISIVEFFVQREMCVCVRSLYSNEQVNA